MKAPALAQLSVERVRSRVSAYVYGNVLVLAAIVTESTADVLDWTALLVVAATTVTTFIAHVVSESVGELIGRTGDAAQLHLRGLMRDAVPIVTSGAVPSAVLLSGTLTVIPAMWALVVAELISVVRIAATTIVVGRRSLRATPQAIFWATIVVSGASLVVVNIKAAFIH